MNFIIDSIFDMQNVPISKFFTKSEQLSGKLYPV